MILAGDVGGTNTRLAVFDDKGGRLTPRAEATIPSREHTSFESCLRQFIGAHPFPIACACIGIAGPVQHGRSDATNLPWVVDARQVAKELSLDRVELINDLGANAYGIAALESKDFVVLNGGAPDAEGNQAIISAGTGLGEAGLYWDGKVHRPFATEGGHATFAPQNELEVALLGYLSARYEHVSFERVLSGPGLVHIYTFLRDSGRGEEPTWLAQQMQQQDPPEIITRAALEGKSTLCVQALDLFVSLYGSEAGNLALKVMATGGVFIGGGIAPKIIGKFKDPIFLNAFTAKGRMKPLLQAMPVQVILNDKTALLGAARYAAMALETDPSPVRP